MGLLLLIVVLLLLFGGGGGYHGYSRGSYGGGGYGLIRPLVIIIILFPLFGQPISAISAAASSLIRRNEAEGRLHRVTRPERTQPSAH